jgi:hypothetical protein
LSIILTIVTYLHEYMTSIPGKLLLLKKINVFQTYVYMQMIKTIFAQNVICICSGAKCSFDVWTDWCKDD